MKRVRIGIHVHVEPERLHATLASLRMNTSRPVDLLLLPDGPDEATKAALATLRNLPQSGTIEPLGPPACFNRLAVATDASVLVLLESGSLIGPGWQDYLLAALEADPRNGLAGPSTNRSWNEQCVFPRSGGTSAEIARTAQEAARRFGTTWRTLEPLHSLADFCYVVRREVVRAIGGADESYSLGPCWEMDYNIRAARAGFRGVWACGAYVHRLPLTARRVREEARLIEANKRRYQDKFCALRLRRERTDYEPHCRGEVCEYFAPKELIQIRLPLAEGSKQAQNTGPPTLCSQQPEPSSPSVESTIHNPQSGVEDLPLVSCIMPTYNRRSFVSQAIKYFLRQDYPNRELIIVDDGTDPVRDLAPDDPRIRYLCQDHKNTLGAKRNLACQEARGEVIVHWDDDDWMASWRLRYQVESLLKEQADLCGLHKLVFYDPVHHQAWQYVYPKGSRPWLAGGTLCYTKAFWRRNPFPDVNVGEDSRFVWSSHTKKIVALQDSTFYVALIHPGNTSPKQTQGVWWHSFSTGEIRDLTGEDWAFYADPLHRQDTPETQVKAAGNVPLVSCIMPTHNRRAFVPYAIRYFLRQDYLNKELIVVDDGADPVSELMPDDPQVRYLRVNQKHSVGAKRNLAVQAARGEFIVHWDDDDWYAAGRLTAQMQKLLQNEADVVALSMRYVLSLASLEFWRCQPELHSRLHYMDLCPGTMAYRRRLWERYGPYPEASLAWGEDVVFLRALPRPATRICRLADEELFVCIRHGHNTWRIAHDWNSTRQGWQKIPMPPFLPAADYQGYVRLAQTAAQQRLQPTVT
jgi:glycosyltransferase involved in cell wall biosynthesis